MNSRLLLVAAIGGILSGLVWLFEPVTVPVVNQPVQNAEPLVPVLIDWTKATDGQRFALLKPVMTFEEVKRLKIEKMDFVEGCGSATDDRGYTAPAFAAGYSYKLTGRDGLVGIEFHNHGEFQSPEELSKQVTQTQASDWRFDRGASQPVQSKWTLVAFRADGVLYRRNKEGLYVAQSPK